MSPYTEPQPADDDQLDSPMLASIRRFMQQIEDSKPNLICSPADRDRIAAELERRNMTHMVNLHASGLCKDGEAYVAKPISSLVSLPAVQFPVVDGPTAWTGERSSG